MKQVDVEAENFNHFSFEAVSPMQITGWEVIEEPPAVEPLTQLQFLTDAPRDQPLLEQQAPA